MEKETKPKIEIEEVYKKISSISLKEDSIGYVRNLVILIMEWQVEKREKGGLTWKQGEAIKEGIEYYFMSGQSAEGIVAPESYSEISELFFDEGLSPFYRRVILRLIIGDLMEKEKIDREKIEDFEKDVRWIFQAPQYG